MITEIRIPQLSVNDTQALLAAWSVSDKELVKKDQEIGVIETSKVTHALLAERAGYIHQKAEPGQDLPVHAVIGWITDQIDEKIETTATRNPPASEIQITLKARTLAEQLGIPLKDLPKKEGILREKDIQDYATSHGLSKSNEHSS